MINNELLNKNEKGPFISLSNLSFELLEMVNGCTRLETRFNEDESKINNLKLLCGKKLNTVEAFDNDLITIAPDDLDWKEEIRINIEERASFSPD